MTRNTLMDTFTLVVNGLEKQHSISWSFSNWKESSNCFQNHPPEVLYEKRSEACNLVKKEVLALVFSYEFCGISKKTFFTEHLWTTASVLYGVKHDSGFLPQHFKNIYYWKINCGKHYRLLKYIIKFRRTSSGTAKAIATFKETTNCKIRQAVDVIWALGTDFSSCFSNHSLKKRSRNEIFYAYLTI